MIKNNKKHIIIIGAGVSGLTCALKLINQGYKVTVLEKESTVGGLAKTIEFKGCMSDLGPHQFCTDNPELLKILKEVLGEDFLIRKKKVSQYFQGKFVNYPLKVVDFITNINPVLTVKVGFEVLFSRIKSIVWGTADYSFSKWVETRFGKTMNRIYFGPYTKKVWGIDPNKLDPRTASSRVAFNSIFDLIIKTTKFLIFKISDYNNNHSPLKAKFYYSKKGIGNFMDRLANTCQEKGVRISTNSKIKNIITIDNQITTLELEDNTKFDNFDFCIATVPITSMLKMLNELPKIMPLKFRSMLVVLLKIHNKIENPYSWIYFPDPKISFQRITDYTHFDESMVEKGSSSLCAEISCFKEDEIWEMNDMEIIDIVKNDLISSGIIESSHEVEGIVHREDYAYPIQVNGYLEIVENLLSILKKYNNLYMSGRQGVFKYCDMDECMEMAIDLSNKVNTSNYEYDLNCNFKGQGVD